MLKKIVIIDGTSFFPGNQELLIDEASCLSDRKKSNKQLKDFIPNVKSSVVVPLVGYTDDVFVRRLANAFRMDVSSIVPEIQPIPHNPHIRLRTDQILIDKHPSFTTLILVGDPAEYEGDLTERDYFSLLEKNMRNMYGYEILIFNVQPKNKQQFSS